MIRCRRRHAAPAVRAQVDADGGMRLGKRRRQKSPHQACAWKGVHEQNGIRCVWSRPLFTRDGRLLGTFSLNYPETRSPAPQDLQLIEDASHITGIAIERHLHEQALQRERDRLQLLLDITSSVTSKLDLRQMVEALPTNLFKVMQCDVSALMASTSTGLCTFFAGHRPSREAIDVSPSRHETCYETPYSSLDVWRRSVRAGLTRNPSRSRTRHASASQTSRQRSARESSESSGERRGQVC